MNLFELTKDFTDAFNRDDLDGVMAFFSEDAVYDQFDGSQARGLADIRAAFEPQFRGEFGTIRFHEEDVFVDLEAHKVLTRWTCTFENQGGKAGWRGLDILHFVDGRITYKGTYAKAETLKLENAG